jgi:hypothetical protein
MTMNVDTIDINEQPYFLQPYQKEMLNMLIKTPGWYHNADWDELDKLFEDEL